MEQREQQPNIPEEQLEQELVSDAMEVLEYYGDTEFCEFEIPRFYGNNPLSFEQWMEARRTRTVSINGQQLCLTTTFNIDKEGNINRAGVAIQRVLHPDRTIGGAVTLYNFDPAVGVLSYPPGQKPRPATSDEINKAARMLDGIYQSLDREFSMGRELMRQAQQLLENHWHRAEAETTFRINESITVQRLVDRLVTPAIETRINDRAAMVYLAETISNDPDCPIDPDAISMLFVSGNSSEAAEIFRLYLNGRITDENGNRVTKAQMNHAGELLSLMKTSLEV